MFDPRRQHVPLLYTDCILNFGGVKILFDVDREGVEHGDRNPIRLDVS